MADFVKFLSISRPCSCVNGPLTWDNWKTFSTENKEGDKKFNSKNAEDEWKAEKNIFFLPIFFIPSLSPGSPRVGKCGFLREKNIKMQISLYTDIVLFFFSFFSKHRRVRERSSFYLLSARSTDFEEKIGGLWKGWMQIAKNIWGRVLEEWYGV